jgi:hypothetical protein
VDGGKGGGRGAASDLHVAQGGEHDGDGRHAVTATHDVCGGQGGGPSTTSDSGVVQGVEHTGQTSETASRNARGGEGDALNAALALGKVQGG